MYPVCNVIIMKYSGIVKNNVLNCPDHMCRADAVVAIIKHRAIKNVNFFRLELFIPFQSLGKMCEQMDFRLSYVVESISCKACPGLRISFLASNISFIC